ncbi:MAG TPA: nicotinate phosphoribosyltransferase, partial [Ruminiclostridium sp.]|nr:nicotinate phosphoribosyltransferase [Ruminiclostridium sp.]
PKIKISENVGKITNPGFKQVWRLFDKAGHKAIADVITLHGEIIDETKAYELFDPVHIWKRKTVSNFYAKKLLTRIFEKGACVYESPDLKHIKEYCRVQLDTLWEEVLRFENPHRYYVDLSQSLWNLKDRLLKAYLAE